MTQAQMPLSPEDQRLIRRYLLGEVDDATIARVEERVVDDEAFFDAIERAEDELIEEYLRGTGSPQERQALARFIDTPERQRQLTVAREMAQRFGAKSGATSALGPRMMTADVVRPGTLSVRRQGWTGQWIGLAAAASVLISAGSAVYFGMQARSVRADVTALMTRESTETPGSSTSAPQAVQSFLVAPERTLRSSGGTDFVLAVVDRSRPIALHFQLTGAATSATYIVVVRRVGGQQEQVWGETGLSPIAGHVVATIPSSILTPDDYLATVSKAEGDVVADYRFRVAN